MRVGEKSFMFEKKKFDALPDDSKTKLLESVKAAHEAVIAGESAQEKLKPALEVVKEFGL